MERKAGAIICANSHGYFKPGNLLEMQRYAKTLDRDIRSRLQIRRCLQDAIDECTGQLRMEK